MRLLPAAAIATGAALLELSVGPHLAVSGAPPHFVLVVGVVWAVATRSDTALVYAFAGGLALDFLAPRPLGATALALLIVVGGALIAASAAPPRARFVLPLAVVPIASLAASLILVALLSVAGTPVAAPDGLARLLPGTAYDTVLAALLGPVVIAVQDRRQMLEAPAL